MLSRLVPVFCFLLIACGGSTASDNAAPAAAGSQLEALTGDHVWKIDKAVSTLIFEASQQGTTFVGRFNEFDAAIRLDPADLSDAVIRAEVKLASVDAGDRDRNASLPSADWFDVKAHPVASFVSESVKRLEDGSYVASGMLTIKGASRALDLPFTLAIDQSTARASGTVDLNRRDFNVGSGQFETDEWVGHDVRVKLDIVASR